MKVKNRLSVASIIGAVIYKIVKSKAAKSGEIFESVVHSLEEIGFKIFSHKQFTNMNKRNLPSRYIICNVPYENLLSRIAKKYGFATKNTTKSRTEFVIVANDIKTTKEFPVNKNSIKIRVECKWQTVSGTAQQKLLYTATELKYCIPENNAILLMDGGGFDYRMKNMITKMIDGNIRWDGAPVCKKKNVKVMDMEEFIDWCNRAFSD